MDRLIVASKTFKNTEFCILDGAKSSTYFNTGNGHAFYKSKNGVSFHENSNKGFRDYTFKQTPKTK